MEQFYEAAKFTANIIQAVVKMANQPGSFHWIGNQQMPLTW